MNNSLTHTAARGATWSGMSRALVEGLRLISTVILARLLLPEDYGIIAIAISVTSIAIRVVGLGFGESIIQRKQITQTHLSTAFWTQLCFGIVLCLVAVGASSSIARFFKNDLVGPVLAVSSLSFVIVPVGSIQAALLRKRLQFSRTSIADLGEALTYITVAVVMAVLDFGVWSLVIGGLAGNTVLVVLRSVLSRWHPSLEFSAKHLKTLWGFGANVTADRLVQVGSGRLDYLVLGRFFTMSTLGFYSMASRVVMTSLHSLSFVVARVAFPVFSKIEDENERLRRGFLKSTAFIVVLGLPVFCGLAVVAPEAVRIVLGDKWLPSVLAAQILCISASFQVLGMVIPYLFMAKGRPDINLKLRISKAILVLPALLLVIRFGIEGVAVVVSTMSVIVWLAQLVYVRRLLGLKLVDYLSSIKSYILCSTAMILVLIAFRQVSTNLFTLSDVWLLVSSVALGGFTYFGILRAIKDDTLNEMTALGMEMGKQSAKLIITKLPIPGRAAKQQVLNSSSEEG